MYDGSSKLTRSSTHEGRGMKRSMTLKYKPVACLLRQMSLGDKGNWSHQQWNMLLIQSRFTCALREWSIMLLKRLIKSSLGPSVVRTLMLGMCSWPAIRCQGRFRQSRDPWDPLSPLDGCVFVLQLCLCLIGREVRADNRSAGCIAEWLIIALLLLHLITFFKIRLLVQSRRWANGGESKSEASANHGGAGRFGAIGNCCPLSLNTPPPLVCWQRPA